MSRLDLAVQTVWSQPSAQALKEKIRQFRPDVLHVHNTFPLLSPSVLWAAQQMGVPVVQTLHNFRLLCPQAMFLREGRVCEDCLGGMPWAGRAARLLPWVAGDDRGDDRDDRRAPHARHLAAAGRPLHRAERLLPPQVHRGRPAARAHRHQAQLRRPAGARARSATGAAVRRPVVAGEGRVDADRGLAPTAGGQRARGRHRAAGGRRWRDQPVAHRAGFARSRGRARRDGGSRRAGAAEHLVRELPAHAGRGLRQPACR